MLWFATSSAPEQDCIRFAILFSGCSIMLANCWQHRSRLKPYLPYPDVVTCVADLDNTTCARVQVRRQAIRPPLELTRRPSARVAQPRAPLARRVLPSQVKTLVISIAIGLRPETWPSVTNHVQQLVNAVSNFWDGSIAAYARCLSFQSRPLPPGGGLPHLSRRPV